MKRLIFFILGLIFFIWLLLTVVKFIMNTDFYKRIASLESPLAAQSQETPTEMEDEKDTSPADSKENDSAESSVETTSPQPVFTSSKNFTAGTRGTEGAAFLLDSWSQEKTNERFQVIAAMENAMGFSVEEALKNSDDPEQTLQEILQNFTQVHSDGQQVVNSLTAEQNTLAAEIADGEATLKDLEAQYFAALNAGDKEKSDAIFEKYVALKKDLVEKKARLGQVEALLQKASSLIAQLSARIAGLRANEKALICGISPSDLTAQAQIQAQKISHSASAYIPEFHTNAPQMTGSGYILGESTPVEMPHNLTFSGDTGNTLLPKHVQDLRIPQLYENGWNTMGMRPVYAHEVDYLEYLVEDSTLY